MVAEQEGPESEQHADDAGLIAVEVAYAEPEQQLLEQLTLPRGSTVQDAITASRVREVFPQVEIDSARLGIFGRKATLDEPLRNGDRVEIYRPLLADPKVVRRARAEAQKD